MAECDYCEERFDDEEALLEHMGDEHEGELGRIDQRRVADVDGGGGGEIPTGPIALGLIIFVSAAVVVFVVFGGGGGGGNPSQAAMADPVSTPTNVGYGSGHPHYHGTITVTIGGETIDFSQRKYQGQADGFHFEGGNGERWHGHGNDITLEYALETLGIGVTNSTLQFEGTVYNRTEGDTVVYKVNGKRVNPETYELQEGDTINVTARDG